MNVLLPETLVMLLLTLLQPDHVQLKARKHKASDPYVIRIDRDTETDVMATIHAGLHLR